MSHDQILRTGVLFKKGSGVGPFGRKNWKPRYFVLTPTRLKYYTFEDGDLKGELDLSGCDEGVIEVMPADSMKTGSSASTIWRIAINAPERRLLVAAGTEMEMNDWVDKLVMAFRINNGQPVMQHRASMPSSIGSNDPPHSHGITDFQNFAAARKSVATHNMGRHSLHAHQNTEFRLSEENLQRLQAEQLRKQLQQQAEEEEEAERARQAEHVRQLEEEARAVEEAREAEEQRRVELQKKMLAEEKALKEQLKNQQMEEMLEEQRRQKREEHERARLERERLEHERLERERLEHERLEHERLERERLERERSTSGQETQMTEKPQYQFEDSDDEEERIPQPQRGSEQQRLSSPVSESPEPEPTATNDDLVTPPSAVRSSLVGDVKREMIMKQQIEHQRRREAAIKEEQHKQLGDFRHQQQHALEEQRAQFANMTMETPPPVYREVEIPARPVVEISRRVPQPSTATAAHAPPLADTGSRDSFEL